MCAMLRITRVFDAPRAVVYRAFVDPDQLAAWFGPAGWSVPRETIDMDVRTGGHQRLIMVNDADPSLTSPVDAVFAEVVENELIVGETRGDEPMRLRLEFHDEPGGRTRLELTQGPYTPGVEGQAREGWTTSFAKLDQKITAWVP
jgi:uncharacterized protein YndB with AHSA1/START domain